MLTPGSQLGAKYLTAAIPDPTRIAAAAAQSGTRRVLNATSVAARIGMKYSPRIFCKYSKIPPSTPAKSPPPTTAATATTAPKIWPTRTVSWSVASGLSCAL